jgi:hypothetical protein
LALLLLGADLVLAQQAPQTRIGPNGAAAVTPSAVPRCDANCVRVNAAKASEACAPRIEAQAPSDFDWIARPTPGIFQQADPSSPIDSIVRFRGDSIRFMTAEKAWVRVSYECNFDVAAQSVTSVQVRVGRLDQPLPAASSQKAPSPAPAVASNAAQASTAGRPRPRVWEPSPIEIQQQAANPKRN